MKKTIFILSMGMLLIGANANAATFTVGEGGSYTTLQAAVTAAKSGDVIEFTSDLTDGGALVKKNLTIDLKGFTYNYAKPAKPATTGTRNIKVDGKYTVTVQNGTIVGTCVVPADYASKESGACGDGAYGTVRADNGATLVLNNLTLYNYHPWGLSVKVTDSESTINSCVFYSTIGGGIEVNTSTATLNNCQFNQKEANKKYGYLASCINVSCLGTIYVNNSSFKSEGEHSLYVFNSGGHIIVNNGLFSGTANVIQVDRADSVALAWEYSDAESKALMTPEEIHAAQLLIEAFAQVEGFHNASEIKINDGRFTGLIKNSAGENGLAVSGGTFEIKGGTAKQQEDSKAYLDAAIISDDVEKEVEKVTNPDGTVSVINTDDKKSEIPSNPEEAKEAVVITTPASNMVITDVKEIKQLNVSNTSTVTVKDGGVLKVNGQTGITVGNTAKVIVEPGGKVMIENGLAWCKNAASIVIEANDTKSGEFLISPNVQMYGDQHPAATVKMVATIGKVDASNAQWYRFGVPMSKMSTLYTSAEVTSYIYGWNAGSSQWQLIPDCRNLKPFEGYQITNNGTVGAYTYEFTGELFGNSTDTATFVGAAGSWASFANSYTGKASALKILDDAIKSGELQSIKLWDPDKQQFDQTVTIQKLQEGDVDAKIANIAPLRPIIFQTKGASASMIINYKEAIWDVANPAPAVAARQNEEVNPKIYLTFNTANDKFAEVDFFQNAEYSDEFNATVDNTYSSSINGGAFGAYAVAKDTVLSSVGLADLHEAVFEIKSTTNTSVAINCTKLQGGNYAIKTADDKSYDLSVKDSIVVLDLIANEAMRLTLIDKKVPTAFENIDAEKVAVKGVYNLVGQYMGESLNDVPAGLYIVNGKKVVK